MNIKTLSLTLILTLSSLIADEADKNNIPDIEKTGNWMFIPFAFSSDTTGLAGGVASIAKGVLQPQTTLVTALFYGVEQDIITNGLPDTSNFAGGLISYTDVKIPFTNRFYLSFFGMMAHYPQDVLYIDGSNDSNKDDGLVTASDSQYTTLALKYILPIGEGAYNPDGLYKMKDGFAMDREDYGNGVPFETGRTSLSLIWFYQYQTVENWKESYPWNLSLSMPEWNDSGFRIALEHDNTDYDLNPSRGYNFKLQYSSDSGSGDNLQEWNNIEFRYSYYMDLENLSFTKQDVLAMSFWTSYSPSWDTNEDILPGIALDRPPMWEGPRLGGYNRMRGYDLNRFSGKAAVYATAEYRAMLKWNPFKKTTMLGKWMPAKVDWLQVVGFVEAGRVANEYSFDLLTDMKYDVGLSLRAMVAELPVRFDVAYGEEGASMWVMYRQPFDF